MEREPYGKSPDLLDEEGECEHLAAHLRDGGCRAQYEQRFTSTAA